MSSANKESWKLNSTDQLAISENHDGDGDNQFLHSDEALMPPPSFTPHGSAIDVNPAKLLTAQEAPAVVENATSNESWTDMFKHFFCQEVQPILLASGERLDVATVEMSQCLVK